MIWAAIDYGEKHCGIAYSPNGTNVFPLSIVPPEALETALVTIIEDKKITGFVVGLPLSTDGSDNPLCQEVRQLARRLKRQFDRPVEFVDERYSSKAVAGVGRVDDLAAGQILEYYLAQC